MSLQNNTSELNIIGSHIAHMKEEYGTQSGLIAQIKTVLQQKASGEKPENRLAKLVDGSLTEITASDLEGVTKIRDYAFYYAPITSAVIPNSVTSIGQYAFYNCKDLASITIGESVTSIGNNAFRVTSPNTTATVRFLGTTPPTISTTSFYASHIEKIIVPKGYGDTYKNATNFSNFADYIVESET